MLCALADRASGSPGLTLVMGRRIVCMCGYVVQGDDDEELWRNAEAQMGLLHPELAHRARTVRSMPHRPQASWGFTNSQARHRRRWGALAVRR